ncbi:hypothetical protein L21SP3_01878 [Sedimentisphaera cyanobacteriorum]|uniref:Mitochondrial fission ELM1 family protein n=1 Tax=Sedimentisphaera cyanobacteriorum TaxID=1940790 RepID=A0A1Q2HS04_9BACT|nr:ELM1/GtrOC1 family putative glycosyltransferase [Sedimentisphaera cyanobacteriorum]AQQ10054.1 hypothetical protein L21SP3_01878 [Sedimentisphaera cyanobacteriorum]
MEKVLIISDGKPGHVNQARALCSIMGWECIEAVAEYRLKAFKAAGYLLDSVRLHSSLPFTLTFSSSGERAEAENMPAGITRIAAVSSGAYYPAKVLANRLGVEVIALMLPRGIRKSDFSHIFCPSYDNPPRAENITPVPITLCSRGESFYAQKAGEFTEKTGMKGPSASVIIGGENAYGRIEPEKIRGQLEKIFEKTPNLEHWLTTSRRTSRKVEKTAASFPFDYKLIFSESRYNPIPAFIGMSEYIFVTSDSSSMISECVSTGSAKVEVLKNEPKRKSKFDRFLAELQAEGCVHIFDGTLGDADRKINLEEKIRSVLED